MKYATLALASLFLTGCSDLVSLNPFATAKQAILDSNLAGTWSGDDNSLYIVQEKDASYSITYTDGKDAAIKLKGTLFKAGDAELMDLVNENEGFLQVPVHAVVRVWAEGNQLRWTFLDSRWLREQTGKEVAFQPSVDKSQLLTAPSESVSAVVLKYAADEKAYENKPNVLTRVQ